MYEQHYFLLIYKYFKKSINIGTFFFVAGLINTVIYWKEFLKFKSVFLFFLYIYGMEQYQCNFSSLKVFFIIVKIFDANLRENEKRGLLFLIDTFFL